MQVTQCQIFPVDNPQQQSTKAFARVILDDELVVAGLRVVDGRNGLFVSYPNDPTYKGRDYKAIVYCLTKELREHIEAEVLKKYNEVRR